MNYWKVIFATVVIFGAGVITGGLLVDFTQRNLFSALHHGFTSHPPSNHPATTGGSTTNHPQDIHWDGASPHPSDFYSRRSSLLQKMDSVLKLTPQQHDAVLKLITEGQGQINKVMQDTFKSVRDQLTPDQQKLYEDMLKQFHQGRPAVPANTNTVVAPLPPAIPPVMTNASKI